MTPGSRLDRASSVLRGRLIQNASWLTFSYAFAKPLWFLFITAGCMRLLSEESYGQFTTALALALLLSSLSDLGSAEYTVREVARRRGVARHLYSNLLVGRSLLALATVVIAVFVALGLGYSGPHLWAVVLAGAYAVAFRGAEYCRSFYRGFEQLRDEAVLTVIEKVLVVGGGLIGLALYRSAPGAFGGMALGMAAATLLNVWWVHSRYAKFSLRAVELRTAFQLFRRALPLGAVAAFGLVPLATAPVVVDAVLGTAAAGEYGAAQRVVEATLLVTTVVVIVVFPRLSAHFYRKEHDEFRRLFAGVLIGLIALGVLAGGMLSLLAGLVIHILAGAGSFLESVPTLAALAWVLIPMNVVYFTTTSLIAADAARAAIITTGCAAALCLVLLIVLTSRVGLIGAVVALAATYSALGLANLVVLNDLRTTWTSELNVMSPDSD